jgi:hypothetical protein
MLKTNSLPLVSCFQKFIPERKSGKCLQESGNLVSPAIIKLHGPQLTWKFPEGKEML